MSYQVDNSDKCCPALRIRSGDCEISFTVKDVAPEAREWLGKVLDRQINELVDLRVREAVEAHKKALRELLGVQP
jgi:hypothetical protein